MTEGGHCRMCGAPDGAALLIFPCMHFVGCVICAEEERPLVCPACNQMAERFYVLQQSAGRQENVPYCGHGYPALKLTVQKDTPNRGRPYWTCPVRHTKGPDGKPSREPPCEFFRWADAPASARSSSSSAHPGPKTGAPVEYVFSRVD